MRLISFEKFRLACKDMRMDCDFDKWCCDNVGHDKAELFTMHEGKKYFYHRCCEKHCPVLGACRKVKTK